MIGLCIQPRAPSESSTLPSLSPTRNLQPTPQPTTRRNQNAEPDREVCLKLFAHYKNSKLILIRYFVTTKEHAWIQNKGHLNLLPYLFTPLPRTKMLMIASFVSEKIPSLLYDKTYQLTRLQKPIIHWEGGGCWC